MTLTLNSLLSLNSAVRFQHVSSSFMGHDHCSALGKASGQKADRVSAPLGLFFTSRRPIKDMRRCRPLSATDSNRVVTGSSNTDSESLERSLPDDQLSAPKPVMPLNSAAGNIQPNASSTKETSSRTQEAANGPQTASETKQNSIPSSSSMQSMPKRSSLTAREKLRAARVLSRYTESKPPKAELGRKVLDAMRESDGGKARSGLPEAPTNLFDDSKRGMPKQGLTFDFPGGFDLFLIIFSAVFIGTLMFATTYVVWKAGAIHFNEY
ncbi:uncharacterized protein LOC131225213 [Magnolia sinica]|uniref:uncharacterized protein LOC131225213 n=1 Tax=Magnolia sinica TaxID=86752 RepID=UPI00265B4C4E|nr:uncharacterized protein LOC131225213 [Magnolia sinica]